MKRWTTIGLALALLVLVLAMSCEQVTDPLTVSQFKTSNNAVLFNAATGVQKSVFYVGENVFLTINDLYPNEQTDIQIVRKSDGNIIKRMLVISDENGSIVDLPVWFLNGFRKPGELAGDHKFVAHIEQPGVGHDWKIFSIPFEARDQITPDPGMGLVNGDTYEPLGQGVIAGQPVWIAGINLGAHVTYKFLLVNDRNNYTLGEAFTDVSDNGIETDRTERDGTFEPTKISNSAILGAYDIIADREPFGVYNTGDWIGDPKHPGVVVQNPASGAHIIQDIACDAYGTHKNQFDSLEVIYGQVTAMTRPQGASEFVTVFIAPHKPVWMKGDKLFSLRTVGTHEMPVQCLWNGYWGYLPVIRIHGGSLATDPNPIKMWPGEYDVILDVDRNNVYDPGVDILDGGALPGFTVPGKVPPVRFGASADLDFLGRTEGDPDIWGYFRDHIKTPVWGVLVDSLGGFISGVPIKFSISEGSGTLSTTTATTGLNGAAYTVFSGLTWGKSATVKLEARVKDKDYVRYVLIFRKIPWQHNQGIIVHNQGTMNGN